MKNKEADIKMQQLQVDLADDIPFNVNIGKRTFKCRYLNSWTQRKITRVLLKAEALDSEGGLGNLFKAVKDNSTLAPKVVSYLILRSAWKVKLFHWFFWRYLDRTCPPRYLNDPLISAVKSCDMGFFLQNMGLMSELMMSKKKWTIAEVAQFRAEQNSDQEQASVKSSE